MITLLVVFLILCIVVALLVLLSSGIWALIKGIFTVIFFPIIGLLKIIF